MEQCQAILGRRETGENIRCTGQATKVHTAKSGTYIHLCQFCAQRATHESRLKAARERKYLWRKPEEPEVPWPKKPLPGARCDAIIGSTTDKAGAPVLVRCSNIAAETVIAFMETWVCRSCAEAMEKHGKAKRNPKRRV